MMTEMNFFSSHILALDIGSAALKLALLSHKRGKELLLQAQCIELQNRIAGSEEWGREIAAATADFSKKATVRIDTVKLYASFEGIVLRSYTLPAMPEGELKQAIEWQLQEQIQGDLKRYYWDTHTVSNYPGREGAFILAAAAPKESIDLLLDHLKQRGFRINTLDVTPLPLLQLLSSIGPLPNAIFIDIGARKTDFSLVLNGNLLLHRRIDQGGWQITDQLATSLKGAGDGALSRAQADAIKRESGLIPGAIEIRNAPERPPQARALIRHCVDNLVNELKRFILFCQEQLELPKLEVLILSGGEVLLRGLPQYVKDQMGEELRGELADPLAQITLAIPQGDLESVKKDSPRLANAIAVGNAKSTLRLVSPAIQTRGQMTAKRALHLAAAAGLCAILVGYGMVWKSQRGVRGEIEKIGQEISALTSDHQKYLNLMSQTEQFSGRQQQLDQLTDREGIVLKFFPLIGEHLGDDAMLTQIQYERETLEFTIEGVAVQIDRPVELILSSYVALLEGTGVFEWVTLRLQTIMPGEESRNLAKFTIAAKGKRS